MSGLANHFGEDASLDPPKTEALRAYLTANAADKFDTLAARRLSRADPNDPLRPTSSRFWRLRHAGISDAAFQSKAVQGRTQCAACHADAVDGLFSPLSVHLPEGADR